MKINSFYLDFFFVIWSAIMTIAVILTLTNTTTDLCRFYDEKVEASNLTLQAMEAIKIHKEELDIPLPPQDINETGMLGERYTSITTTLGLLESKRTSLNPNFAAVIIDMFKEAGIKKGSQVAVTFSGSFPAINIAVMAAIQVFDIKPCIMASIGSSSYGANDPDFTFYDMSEYLYQEGIFSNRIDYVSFGGANDIGEEFNQEIKTALINRVNSNGNHFIYEVDYQKNIEERMEYIYDKIPNLKLLINVGGNLVSMGKDEASFPNENGLIKPDYLNHNRNGDSENSGLMDKLLERGIPIIQMLNFKGLSYEYGIPYDPSPIPEIGIGTVYYETKYNILFPSIGLLISIFLLLFYFFNNKKNHRERRVI